MEHNDLFEKMKKTSNEGQINPSNDVWNRLEMRLDEVDTSSEPPSRLRKLFSIRRLSIAASLLLIIGAYFSLNFLGRSGESSSAIQLENLHTIEVNPRYNIPVAGESATIPSVRTIRVSQELYKSTIKEGSAKKKLVPRVANKNENKEYGLG